jgi:hypothetical protein
VQCNGAGVGDAERVEEIRHGDLVQHLRHVPARDLAEGALLEEVVVGRRAEVEVVRYEGVHPVDGDELFRDGVGNPEMVPGRAGDTADHFAAADPSEEPVDPLARHAPPLGPHADLQGGMAEDGGGPFDRVDLREQGRVDEPGVVEEIVIRPGGVLGAQAVADGVVLQHKERLHEGQADPEARLLRRPGDQVVGYRSVGIDYEFAVLSRPHHGLHFCAAAEYLEPSHQWVSVLR